MSDFKIDDGIPLPDTHATRYTRYQKVISELKVGQSFFVATDKVDSVRVLTIKCATRAGVKVATRSWDQEGESGIRIWRIE